MKIKDITNYIEEIAPLSFQEGYDNAGLIVGNAETEINAILISLDVNEEVVDEAINLKANLIVAHHPIVFSGLKKLNGKNYVERTVIKAIQNNIAIYASHTNLDSVLSTGVNTKIAQKLELQNIRILSPVENQLNKIMVYVPNRFTKKIQNALFSAGAGQIGNYNSCSFNLEGKGTFKAEENTDPFVGEQGKLHIEDETKIEVIAPNHLTNKVISEMISAHPYEEPAYDIVPLKNTWKNVGMGIIGELTNEIDEIEFLQKTKQTFACQIIRHTELLNKKIKKVAVCGGAGSFLLQKAISQKADVFVSGDFKYHQFFDADKKILIADIGHFESEQYTKELFYELLIKKFYNFAIHLTKVNTNPIKYF